MLRGDDKSVDNVERLGFAQLAYEQKKFDIAARLWAEALESDPTLGEDRQNQYRYNAACAASLAAAGQSEDEPSLDDAAKAKRRRQALDWLKTELEVWNEYVPTRNGIPNSIPVPYELVVQTLSHWQTDSDLAGIRDATSLAKLPPDEQQAFTRLWADVAALLSKAGGQ